MKDKVILFGAGFYGREAFDGLKDKYEILCFADNNPVLSNTYLLGIPVIPAERILEYKKEDADIVVCTESYIQIGKQLKEMGISSYYIMLDGHLYQSYEKVPDRITTCTRCIMNDSSDNTILFDEKGQCNYCNRAYGNIGKIYFPNAEGQKKLDKLLFDVKESGKGKKYDCIMGLSGGLDSSYLAYLGYQWGLRILAVHIDDGYDTEISKSNLRKLISATGFDYEVIKPDSVQFNDLTLAYMKAGVPNIAVPQDNILFAFIYKKMREYGIKYFLSGGNFALESILQRGNTHSAFDIDNIMDIHNRFGEEPIDKIELLSNMQTYIDKKDLGIESPRPLNFIDYNRERAFKELKEFCSFKYYGRKHLENILTAFIQLYWFPKKFGVDKRTSHLSSMIVSNQMTREEALKEIEEPLYDEKMMEQYISIIKSNLRISNKEFDILMSAPVHQHEDYAVER
ncbi:MAG: N-acetyl sugar amidotransferase [Hungatella sp.]|nr:N-acetyl sugar amidotransferase [Hungatella sp.]